MIDASRLIIARAPKIPPFGFPVAIATYNLEVLSRKKISPSPTLVSFMNRTFLQLFIDANRDSISEGVSRQLHGILTTDGASGVDAFLRDHLASYETRLLRTLRASVKKIGAPGGCVRHVEKLRQRQPKAAPRYVYPFGL